MDWTLGAILFFCGAVLGFIVDTFIVPSDDSPIFKRMLRIHKIRRFKRELRERGE